MRNIKLKFITYFHIKSSTNEGGFKVNSMAIKKNENIVARKIHSSSFLIDISDNYSGDKCSIYEINETGIFIWNNIDGTRNIDELAMLLKNAIIDEVDYQVLYSDVKEFVGTLIDRCFVEV